VLVTLNQVKVFLDKMIALLKGPAARKPLTKIALTILLAGFTLVIIIV